MVLVDLDIHKGNVIFCLLQGYLSSWGELDDGVVVKLVSVGGASLHVSAAFGASVSQYLGL